MILALSWAASLLSAATIDDLVFTLINEDTEYSVKAKDPRTIAGEVDIPATYNGKPVTEIGYHAFGVWDGATGLGIETSGGAPSLLYRKNTDATDVNYQIEQTDDLSAPNWQAAELGA